MKKVLASLLTMILGFAISANAEVNTNAAEALDEKQQSIITIAAFTAKGDLEQLKVQLNKGLDAGLTVNQIKEVIVHTYAYSGFPRSIRGIQTLMAVLDERKAKGINDPMGPEASPITKTGDKYQRGLDVLEEMSGVKSQGRPQSGYGAFSPELETFLKEHLFADIFERDVLTYFQREMVTVSVLISIGGVEPMMRTHMNLFMNTGATPQQVIGLVSLIGGEVSKKDAEAARVVLNELLNSKGLNIQMAAPLTEATPVGK